MKENKKPGAWVLTRSHNDYDQHGEYFQAVFATQPTVEQLANYLSTTTPYGIPSIHNVMDAVAFLEHLRGGGGRRKTEDVWYDLEFVEFQ